MKAILAAILVAAIVTPAAAANSKKTDAVTIKKMHHRGAGAYAQYPMPIISNDVYVDGRYVGSDPDWRVRETLREEGRHEKF